MLINEWLFNYACVCVSMRVSVCRQCTYTYRTDTRKANRYLLSLRGTERGNERRKIRVISLPLP